MYQPVRVVFAHQDCDAVEPAHVGLIGTIEHQLASRGVEAIAVVPAWETEAWFFLWPDAAIAVNGNWRRPARTGQNVGLIENAKEAFRRALRPSDKKSPPRDYVESDAPKIASEVLRLDLIHRPDASSASYELFRRRVAATTF